MKSFAFALLLAIFACSGIYSTAFAPAVSQAVSLASGTTEPASPTMVPVVAQVSDTPAPTVTDTATEPPPTDTPVPSDTPTIEPSPTDTETPTLAGNPAVPAATPSATPILYYTQAGDTLRVVAYRFGVKPEDITSPSPLNVESFLDPGILLLIPPILTDTGAAAQIMPDSEVAFSPSAVDFDIAGFVQKAGGYLSGYGEYLGSTGMTSGADVVRRVAVEYSVNPRLLLALLEYEGGWVYGQPRSLATTDYPLAFIDINHKGLYMQLTWAVSQLSVGYYGWREGLVNTLQFPDGSRLRLAPELNAGTVALQYMYSRYHNQAEWAGALNPDDGLPALHQKMFGNPWLRAQDVEPLFPASLVQPRLILPFMPGVVWSFSGGPHAAFGAAGARAALDFAPGSTEQGCIKSDQWAVAAATGQVVRSERGIVVIDLDGDGHEQTGWSLLYLHIEARDRVPLGTRVSVGDKLGHPSCEGGQATGTHVHMVRKYNGEWILADGPIPFNLDGWRAHAGVKAYDGTLTRDGKTVTACPCGSYETRIIREAGE